MKVTVDFGGGMEVLFGNRKSLAVEGDFTTISDLIQYLKRNELSEREELFVDGNRLRSGILVLINDTDWEVLDKENTQLSNEDNIFFLSTLHGG